MLENEKENFLVLLLDTSITSMPRWFLCCFTVGLIIGSLILLETGLQLVYSSILRLGTYWKRKYSNHELPDGRLPRGCFAAYQRDFLVGTVFSDKNVLAVFQKVLSVIF